MDAAEMHRKAQELSDELEDALPRLNHLRMKATESARRNEELTITKAELADAIKLQQRRSQQLLTRLKQPSATLHSNAHLLDGLPQRSSKAAPGREAAHSWDGASLLLSLPPPERKVHKVTGYAPSRHTYSHFPSADAFGGLGPVPEGQCVFSGAISSPGLSDPTLEGKETSASILRSISNGSSALRERDSTYLQVGGLHSPPHPLAAEALEGGGPAAPSASPAWVGLHGPASPALQRRGAWDVSDAKLPSKLSPLKRAAPGYGTDAGDSPPQGSPACVTGLPSSGIEDATFDATMASLETILNDDLSSLTQSPWGGASAGSSGARLPTVTQLNDNNNTPTRRASAADDEIIAVLARGKAPRGAPCPDSPSLVFKNLTLMSPLRPPHPGNERRITASGPFESMSDDVLEAMTLSAPLPPATGWGAHDSGRDSGRRSEMDGWRRAPERQASGSLIPAAAAWADDDVGALSERLGAISERLGSGEDALEGIPSPTCLPLQATDSIDNRIDYLLHMLQASDECPRLFDDEA